MADEYLDDNGLIDYFLDNGVVEKGKHLEPSTNIMRLMKSFKDFCIKVGISEDNIPKRETVKSRLMYLGLGVEYTKVEFIGARVILEKTTIDSRKRHKIVLPPFGQKFGEQNGSSLPLIQRQQQTHRDTQSSNELEECEVDVGKLQQLVNSLNLELDHKNSIIKSLKLDIEEKDKIIEYLLFLKD